LDDDYRPDVSRGASSPVDGSGSPSLMMTNSRLPKLMEKECLLCYTSMLI
jgi:hypothetical protein